MSRPFQPERILRPVAKILYHAVPVPWRKEENYAFLENASSVAGVKRKHLKPDKKQNWLDLGYREEFDDFIASAVSMQ